MIKDEIKRAQDDFTLSNAMDIIAERELNGEDALKKFIAELTFFVECKKKGGN